MNSIFSMLRNGLEFGGSISKEGAVDVICRNMRTASGTYSISHQGAPVRISIMEIAEGLHALRERAPDSLKEMRTGYITLKNKNTEVVLGAPLWTNEQIDDHHGRLPYTPKHGPTIKHFYMDFFEKTVEGYCLGQSWNGWSVPYFTKAQLESVLPALNAEEYDIGVYWCDREVDSFEGLPVLRNRAHPDEEDEDVWDGERIEGVDEPVWSIGGMSWCWSSEDNPHAETDDGWVEVKE